MRGISSQIVADLTANPKKGRGFPAEAYRELHQGGVAKENFKFQRNSGAKKKFRENFRAQPKGFRKIIEKF